MRKGFAGGAGLCNCGGYILALGDVGTGDAVGGGQHDEVGREDGAGGVVLVVEGLLPLADHAEEAVVDDGDVDGVALLLDSGEFARSHLEAAVAYDDPDVFFGACGFGADGCGEREAHGAEASGGDEGAGGVVFVVLGLPHLVLAYVGDDDSLGRGDRRRGASRQMSLMTWAA